MDALIGILGVVLGLAIGEYFRRTTRIEPYSLSIFEKRFEAYEKLHKRLLIASSVASDTARLGPDHRETKVARQAIIDVVIHQLDKDDFFLDEDLTVHAALTVLSIELDIAQAPNEEERKTALDEFFQRYKELKILIREASGVAELDRHFKSVTKPTLDSEYIEMWRRVKTQPGPASVQEAPSSLSSESD